MNTLTVYFDDPWWVGVIACEEAGTLRVYRHVFGSEPSGEEVLAFVLRDFLRLTSRFSGGYGWQHRGAAAPQPQARGTRGGPADRSAGHLDQGPGGTPRRP